MITAEQYKAVKGLIDATARKEKVNGTLFMNVYNDVFNTSQTFSGCCPSSNRALLNRLKTQARQFETKYPKDAAGIRAALLAALVTEKPGGINDDGINTPEPFDPNATPPTLTEGTPEPINDDGINKPRPNVKPIRKETRGRKRKKDIE